MITLLTHVDLDGCGCAILARLAFENEDLEIEYCDYSNIDSHIMECLDQGVTDQLFITDIAPQNHSVYDRLDKIHGGESLEIVCLDHHRTSEELAEHPWGMCDTSKCGTHLFFLWLVHKGLLPNSAELECFVNAVEAYDLWNLDSEYRERGERLHRLCGFMGFDRFVATFVDSLQADSEMILIELDDMLLERQLRYVERVIETQLDGTIHVDPIGRGYVVTYCEKNFSLVGHTILDRFPGVFYVVNLEPAGNVCQLRSRKGGVDVAEIANLVGGGGGHPSAAGCQFLLREVLFEEIHKRLQLLSD